MGTFFYFSYGSNILERRLCAASRCPSAKVVGRAYAANHWIDFSKKSNDESGKASLIPSRGQNWYGRLFEVPDFELDRLDKAEGEGYGYTRLDHFEVVLEETGETIATKTYLADRRAEGLQPYDWYLALVVAGSVEAGLPAEQLEFFRSTKFLVDPKPDRKTRREALSALGETFVSNLLANPNSNFETENL